MYVYLHLVMVITVLHCSLSWLWPRVGGWLSCSWGSYSCWRYQGKGLVTAIVCAMCTLPYKQTGLMVW